MSFGSNFVFLSLCKDVEVVLPVFLLYLLFIKVEALLLLTDERGRDSSVETLAEVYFSLFFNYLISFSEYIS